MSKEIYFNAQEEGMGASSIPRQDKEKKKKKTKLEKIHELESSMKVLKEDNKRLRREIQALKSSKNNSEDASITSDGQSLACSAAPGDDKLKDALRALKRVTMDQEASLSKLRSKARQRRTEIETKDRMLGRLQGELESLKAAYQKVRGSSKDDVSTLRAKVVDLELQLAQQEAFHEDREQQLSQSKHDVRSLQGQLEKVKDRRVQRNVSSISLRSESTSASWGNEDTARLKRELANKIEKIANLECDLEIARDQIHDMKRNKQFDQSFPTTPAPGTTEEFSDFSDEDSDCWD